ncbi:hypothetical protein KGM_204667 [Danaus plexippus plexippus]|uniref:Uncharacterized protein n=1 Tax=Danaus plexippus plexippus TaxID=278856 RepID=A0A212ESJ5_DANPL|nr:hypothetical protein KGM_204667 [Danaus plexippus plexippus]
MLYLVGVVSWFRIIGGAVCRGRWWESNLFQNVFFNCDATLFKWFNDTLQVQKDFFGRIVQVAEVQKQDGVSDVITSAVFYQYREGFNNAVRRNVRVRDLM